MSERTEPDQELRAIKRCVDAIEALDAGARGRVLAYLCDRYDIRCKGEMTKTDEDEGEEEA